MATKKISELNALTTPESDDLIAIVDASATETKKITYGNISKHIVNVGTEVEEDSRVNFIKSNNLFGTVWENGDLGSNGVPSASSQYMRTADYIVVKPSTQYTLKISASNTQIVVYYYSNGTFLNREYVQNSDTYTFTTPANCNAIKFRLNGTSLTLTNTMLNEGDTATAYEPFTTNEINIDNETFTDTLKVGTDVDGKSRVNFLKSKNLFDKSTALIGYSTNSAGELIPNSNNFVSDFIKVEKNTDYYVNNYCGVVIGYNSSFAFLSVIKNSNTSDTFNTGNAEYIRVRNWYASDSTALNNQLNGAMLNLGTTSLPYEPYIVPSINVDGETFTDTIKVGTDVDSRSRVNFIKGKNLLSTSLELGTYSNEGVKAGSTANYRTANAIKVKPNTTYTFSINGVAQNYAVYLYNSSMTFLASATTSTFTTPANCEYLNFRCFNADFTSDFANLKIQLEEGSTATTYVAYTPSSINVDGETIVNKNVYSSNEVVIGEWFGKPLYRKVIKSTLGTTNGSWKSIGSFGSNYLSEVVKMSGLFIYSGGSCVSIPYTRITNSTYDGREYVLFNCNISSGDVNVIGYHPSNYEYMSGQPVIVIIEYTKTTD